MLKSPMRWIEKKPYVAAAARAEIGRSLLEEVDIDTASLEIRELIQLRAFVSQQDLKHMCKRYTKSPWRIGEVDWHRKERNYELVKQAVGMVTLEDLKGKFKGPKEWYHNIAVLQGDIWMLDGPQLLLARQLGIIDRLPKLTEEQLDDLNKGDALVKLLTFVQIGWLVVQLIVRKVHDLESTQLEIVTLAFAICTLCSYVMLMKKPQDAKVPVDVPARRHPTAAEMVKLASEGPFPYYLVRSNYWMPNNSFHFQGPGKRYLRAFLAGIGAGATVFGCIHLIAWNFVFPSKIEQLLWRIAAIFTVAAPWFSIAITSLGSITLLKDFGYAHFGAMA